MSDAKTPIGKVAAYVKEQIPAQVEKAISEIELPIAKDGVDGIGLNLKAWDEGIYREGTLVQHNMGQAFKALRDTSAEPGSSDDWERMGSAGFRWTGVKNADFAYQDGDLYIDGGTTFMWFNGKGHMFAQRGKNGKDGIDGKDGTDGRDAAKVLEIRWDNKGIAFASDNGDLIEADVPGLEAMQKRLSWLEEQFFQEENIDAPIKAYLGSWKVGESYALGDTVTSGKGFYLCIEADGNSDSLDPDKWIKLAGAAGGGGGGGGGATTQIIMDRVKLNYVAKADLVASSGGAVNQGAVPKLDSNGKLDGSMLSIPGGMTLKGSVDITVAPPTAPKAGDYYIASADGTLNAGYNLGTLAVKKGDTILFTGTDWLENQSQVDLSTVYTKTQVDAKMASFAGGLQFLKITAAAYNALAVKDPKTLYLVAG